MVVTLLFPYRLTMMVWTADSSCRNLENRPGQLSAVDLSHVPCQINGRAVTVIS